MDENYMSEDFKKFLDNDPRSRIARERAERQRQRNDALDDELGDLRRQGNKMAELAAERHRTFEEQQEIDAQADADAQAQEAEERRRRGGRPRKDEQNGAESGESDDSRSAAERYLDLKELAGSRVRLKIDGKEVDVTLDEALRNSVHISTAHQRMEQAALERRRNEEEKAAIARERETLQTLKQQIERSVDNRQSGSAASATSSALDRDNQELARLIKKQEDEMEGMDVKGAQATLQQIMALQSKIAAASVSSDLQRQTEARFKEIEQREREREQRDAQAQRNRDWAAMCSFHQNQHKDLIDSVGGQIVNRQAEAAIREKVAIYGLTNEALALAWEVVENDLSELASRTRQTSGEAEAAERRSRIAQNQRNQPRNPGSPEARGANAKPAEKTPAQRRAEAIAQIQRERKRGQQ